MQIRLLLTSLVRLYAIYLLFGVVQWTLSLISAVSVMPERPSFPIAIWGINSAVTILFAIVLFRQAGRISRFAMPEGEDEAEITQAQVPLHATVLLCFGLFITAWGFFRLTDALRSWLATLWQGGMANELFTTELLQIGPAAVVLIAGLVFCARFSRIARWIKSKV